MREQVNVKRATVGFDYCNFDRDTQLQMRAFYCKERTGDRSDEEATMIATVLSRMLDRLGLVALCLMPGLLSFTIVLQSDLNQRKLAVNKFTWRQYKQFELLNTSGRCQLHALAMTGSHSCMSAVWRTSLVY